MKKTVAALFASLALVLGTGAMGSSAVAAPYPNKVKTYTIILRDAPVTEGSTFYTGVIVFAGNAVVDEGSVRVVFGGKSYSSAVSGGQASFSIKAPGVKKSRFKTIKAYYSHIPGSVFKSSRTSKKIYVKNS